MDDDDSGVVELHVDADPQTPDHHRSSFTEYFVNEEPTETPDIKSSSFTENGSLIKKSALATPRIGSGMGKMTKSVSFSDLNQCYIASHTLEELYPAEDERFNLVDMIPEGEDTSAHGLACVSFAGMDKTSLNPEVMTKLLANQGEKAFSMDLVMQKLMDLKIAQDSEETQIVEPEGADMTSRESIPSIASNTDLLLNVDAGIAPPLMTTSMRSEDSSGSNISDATSQRQSRRFENSAHSVVSIVSIMTSGDAPANPTR